MKTVALFGSTGSIGRQTLDLVRLFKDDFKVEVLTGSDNIDLLIQQSCEFRPRVVITANEKHLPRLKEGVSAIPSIQVMAGEKSLIEMASHPTDILIMGIVGVSALFPTYQALMKGRVIGIANKESIVSAGSLLLKRALDVGAHLVPVDSEHSGLFQIYNKSHHYHIKEMTITASGGPFLHRSLKEIESVTPQEALNHPTWSMGAKNSIDSATLVNKGLELIEAHFLFDVAVPQLKAIIHPQSIVHSLIHFCDGSTLAQISKPCMKIPLSFALFFPNRAPFMEEDTALLDLLQTLDFYEIDENRFKAIPLARQSLLEGKTLIYNAANEVAVNLFLQGRLGFHEIVNVIEETLILLNFPPITSLNDLKDHHEEVIQLLYRKINT